MLQRTERHGTVSSCNSPATDRQITAAMLERCLDAARQDRSIACTKAEIWRSTGSVLIGPLIRLVRLLRPPAARRVATSAAERPRLGAYQAHHARPHPASKPGRETGFGPLQHRPEEADAGIQSP